MKSVTLNYYAGLRDVRGMDTETVLTSSSTLLDLYEELRALHGFRHAPTVLKVAVNDAFAAWEDRVEEGDQIVFIPPVAGG